MATDGVFTLLGLNLKGSIFNKDEGEFLRLVNVDPYPSGALSKRPGLSPFLGTTTGSQVNSLFDWHQDDGITFNLYKASGSLIEYSAQGTGAWTVAGNGTIAAGSFVGYTVLNNTLILGDGTTPTRHTTSGTSFTTTSGAPTAQFWAEYQQHAYAAIGSNVIYSVTGDPTNWSSTGTSDGNSFPISGGGALNGIMKVADRIFTTKNTGAMHRWDGFNLFDMSTNRGPTSFRSIGNLDDFRIYLTPQGYYGFNGNVPQLTSDKIQPQIYNASGSAIAGTTFNTASGDAFRYDYYCSVGTITEDITRETIPNCLQVYNFQLDQWRNYSMGTPITAIHGYRDNTLTPQLIMGDNKGQCYTLSPTATDDNGQPIEAIIEFVFHGGVPTLEKEWNYIWLFFNPGSEAKVQVAVGDYQRKEQLNWNDVGSAADGIVEFHFGKERGRMLFVRISESSRNPKFIFYGIGTDFDPISRS